jgi:hypothetical protein
LKARGRPPHSKRTRSHVILLAVRPTLTRSHDALVCRIRVTPVNSIADERESTVRVWTSESATGLPHLAGNVAHSVTFQTRVHTCIRRKHTLPSYGYVCDSGGIDHRARRRNLRVTTNLPPLWPRSAGTTIRLYSHSSESHITPCRLGRCECSRCLTHHAALVCVHTCTT